MDAPECMGAINNKGGQFGRCIPPESYSPNAQLYAFASEHSNIQPDLTGRQIENVMYRYDLKLPIDDYSDIELFVDSFKDTIKEPDHFFGVIKGYKFEDNEANITLTLDPGPESDEVFTIDTLCDTGKFYPQYSIPLSSYCYSNPTWIPTAKDLYKAYLHIYQNSDTILLDGDKIGINYIKELTDRITGGDETAKVLLLTTLLKVYVRMNDNQFSFSDNGKYEQSKLYQNSKACDDFTSTSISVPDKSVECFVDIENIIWPIGTKLKYDAKFTDVLLASFSQPILGSRGDITVTGYSQITQNNKIYYCNHYTDTKDSDNIFANFSIFVSKKSPKLTLNPLWRRSEC